MFDPSGNVVIGGMKFLKLLSISGKELTSKKGIFGKVGKAQPLPCATFVGEKLITGTADGCVYRWEGRDCKEAIKCTDSEKNNAVMDVRVVSGNTDGVVMVSGAKDGKICLFDERLKIVKTLDLNNVSVGGLCEMKCVVSVDLSIDGARVLCGTKGSEVIEMDAADGEAGVMLMSGHYKDELWGLACHNSNSDLCATSGDDGVVKVWSIGGKKLLCSEKVGDQSRAVSFNGDYVCAGVGVEGGRKKKRAKGDKAGGYCVYKRQGEGGLVKVKEDRCAKEWVGDLK